MLLYNTICTSLTNIQLEQLCDTTTRQEKILVSLQFSYSTTVFFCVFEIDPILRRTQSRGIVFTMRGPNQNCNSQSVVYGAFKFCGFLNVLDTLSLNSTTRKEKILVSLQFSTELRSSLACLKSIKYWGEQSNLLQFEGKIKTAILKV